MNELTIMFDYGYFDKGLEKYLSTIAGVQEVKIHIDKEEIYIKYNSKITSIKILKLEILLFLSCKIPTIIAFNKHPKTKIESTKLIIEDICCEYCYKGMIEDLLEIDGVESANSDYANNYRYDNYKNVEINITYNDKLINKEEIAKIEKKLNCH